MHHRWHCSPFQGMLCKWVHEKRGHGSASLLLFLVASLSELLVHTRAGGTVRALVWVSSGARQGQLLDQIALCCQGWKGIRHSVLSRGGPSGLDGLGSCCGTGRVEGV